MKGGIGSSWGHSDFYPEFNGAVLRAYRLDEGWTQLELSKRVPCVRTLISQWECGHSTPTLTNIDALARALGISRAALLDDDEVISA